MGLFCDAISRRINIIMDTINIVFGVLILIGSVFLVVAVLMQNGKSHGLSGAIAGGAETFFGKQKGATIEKKLSKLTTIVAIIFVLIVLVSYVLQDQTDYDAVYKEYMDALTAETTADETADESDKDTDTKADTEAESEEDGTGTEESK